MAGIVFGYLGMLMGSIGALIGLLSCGMTGLLEISHVLGNLFGCLYVCCTGVNDMMFLY